MAYYGIWGLKFTILGVILTASNFKSVLFSLHKRAKRCSLSLALTAYYRPSFKNHLTRSFFLCKIIVIYAIREFNKGHFMRTGVLQQFPVLYIQHFSSYVSVNEILRNPRWAYNCVKRPQWRNSTLRYECDKVLFRRMRSLLPERSEGDNSIRRGIRHDKKFMHECRMQFYNGWV